jgi:hypothetical protein
VSRAVAVVVAAVFALLLAHPAIACAVCGGAKADNDWAFGITTLILSVLPPILFGCFVFYIVRAYRKSAREEAAAANISTPAE